MEDILEITINTEWDIITARQIARETSKCVGFDIVDQARIVTALGEIAKNIIMYAHVGFITIKIIENEVNKGISITAVDNGPGIVDIKSVLDESNLKGLGAGIPGVRRLMDTLEIESNLGKGTKVHMEKWLR